MEEITHVDQRATDAVHETDRTSHDLIARVYQRLRDELSVQAGRDISEHPGPTQATDSAQLQEALP